MAYLTFYGEKLLELDDLTDLEKEMAKEQNLTIREDEEQRSRDEINQWYSEPMDWEYVKECSFRRKYDEFDETFEGIEVII